MENVKQGKKPTPQIISVKQPEPEKSEPDVVPAGTIIVDEVKQV